MAIDKRTCPSCNRAVRCRKKDGRRSWHRAPKGGRKWCAGSPNYRPGRKPVTHTPLLASEI